MAKKLPTGRNILFGMMVLAAVVCTGLWIGGWTTGCYAGSVFGVAIGLLGMASSCYDVGWARWFEISFSLAITLASLGQLLRSPALDIAGGLTMFAGLYVTSAHARRTPPPPLELSEDIRAEFGLGAETDVQGPSVDVVLVDAGATRMNILRRLRELFAPLGLYEVSIIAKETPYVLQTTTSRRDAEFVAAQLGALGGLVEIRGHEGMADGAA